MNDYLEYGGKYYLNSENDNSPLCIQKWVTDQWHSSPADVFSKAEGWKNVNKQLMIMVHH